MNFTIYERALAEADISGKPIREISRELGLPPVESAIFQRTIPNYLLKIELIKQKNKALENLTATIKNFTESTDAIINETLEVSSKAINMRLNLELSVLESQLKSLEMESVSIDKMTAGDFLNKYGA